MFSWRLWKNKCRRKWKCKKNTVGIGLDMHHHPEKRFVSQLSLDWYLSLEGALRHASWQGLPLIPVLGNCEQVLHRTSSPHFDITSVNQLFLRSPWCQPPFKVPWKAVFVKVSCQVTWPNLTSLHCLSVASRCCWCPTSVATDADICHGAAIMEKVAPKYLKLLTSLSQELFM